MTSARIFKHRKTNKCNKAMEKKLQWRDVEMAARCGDMELSLYEEEGDNMVEGVAIFMYLGRTLDQTDGDWPAVRRNIMRASLVWGILVTLI